MFLFSLTVLINRMFSVILNKSQVSTSFMNDSELQRKNIVILAVFNYYYLWIWWCFFPSLFFSFHSLLDSLAGNSNSMMKWRGIHLSNPIKSSLCTSYFDSIYNFAQLLTRFFVELLNVLRASSGLLGRAGVLWKSSYCSFIVSLFHVVVCTTIECQLGRYIKCTHTLSLGLTLSPSIFLSMALHSM